MDWSAQIFIFLVHSNIQKKLFSSNNYNVDCELFSHSILSSFYLIVKNGGTSILIFMMCGCRNKWCLFVSKMSYAALTCSIQLMNKQERTSQQLLMLLFLSLFFVQTRKRQSQKKNIQIKWNTCEGTEWLILVLFHRHNSIIANHMKCSNNSDYYTVYIYELYAQSETWIKCIELVRSLNHIIWIEVCDAVVWITFNHLIRIS